MKLPLKITINDKIEYLKINPEKIYQAKEELDLFLYNKSFFNNYEYSLKSLNYLDNNDKRFMNIKNAYKYIFKGEDINKDNLKKLYQILSDELIDTDLLNKMNEYYRTSPVYILNHGRLDNYDMGIDASKIDEYMKMYFNFLYNYSMDNEFIKSQIIHFYLVYIHPYYDTNGRVARAMTTWYLLNNENYPYTVFNRGLSFNGNKYDEAISDIKKYGDISFFIKYMFKIVQKELEKDYIIKHIDNKVCIDNLEYKTLLYLISMNGLITVCDFATIYNKYNEKKKIKVIYETMLDTLIQKKIINVVSRTNNNMFENFANEVLEINEEFLDYDKNDIKVLKKYKKSS